MQKKMGFAILFSLLGHAAYGAPEINSPTCPNPIGSASAVYSVKLTDYDENGGYTETLVCSGTPQVNLFDYRSYPDGCENSNPPAPVGTCQFQFGNSTLSFGIYAELMYFNYPRFSLPAQDWKQAILLAGNIGSNSPPVKLVQTYSITPNLNQTEFYLFGHPTNELIITDSNGIKHYLNYIIDMKITENP